MSGIQGNSQYKNEIVIGNSRSSEWRGLRLQVYRSSSDYLTAALVQTDQYSIGRLDIRTAGLQVVWDPDMCETDLRLYALQQALSAIAQTRF